MIIVKLWGGMCNQLFQYAFGYALASKTNEILYFDIDFYKKQPTHVGRRAEISGDDFSLTKLNILDRPLFAKVIENKYINHIIRYNWGCDITLGNKRYVIERLHHYYEDIPYTTGITNYYDGYWQSWKYFHECADLIRNEFKPAERIRTEVDSWKRKLPTEDTVAIHIRRGDYLNKRNQGRDTYLYESTEYYHRAINIIQGQLDHPLFCFFSDDIDWCKSEFADIANDSEFVVNSGSDAAIVDLFSIAACKHGILSPSSFSWWGNWLKESNSNSIVIAPKQIDINPYLNPNHWVII